LFQETRKHKKKRKRKREYKTETENQKTKMKKGTVNEKRTENMTKLLKSTTEDE